MSKFEEGTGKQREEYSLSYERKSLASYRSRDGDYSKELIGKYASLYHELTEVNHEEIMSLLL